MYGTLKMCRPPGTQYPADLREPPPRIYDVLEELACQYQVKAAFCEHFHA